MVVCLALPGSARYLTEVVGTASTMERVVTFLSAITEVQEVLVVAAKPIEQLPAAWRLHQVDAVTESTVCEALALITANAETEILFASLDQPFLNLEITRALSDRHRTHLADYTFADGYPQGLAPEIVSGRVIAHLKSLATDAPLARNGLFPIVARDINRIDVETLLSRADHRLLRLSLSVDTKANLNVCRSLAQGEPTAIDEWETHVRSTQQLHRTLPRFISVQVLEQEVQRVSYSPYPDTRDNVTRPGKVMSADLFSDLISMIDDFSPEAVIHLSLWGEIGLHPQALELVRAILSTDSLSLLLETSGVGWKPSVSNELLGVDSDRFQLIVGLDTADPELYQQIRGDGFAEATDFARNAVERMEGRAHVQAVRSDLTEPTLQHFYKRWKESTGNVIIQKYDHFCKRLPQIRIGDLSPIERFPCWHLQRDLHVLVDGTAPLCREDLDATEGLGNLFEDGIESVWSAGDSRYAAHVSGSFNGLCRECDEYYTFSF